jgi:hypothetical protein
MTDLYTLLTLRDTLFEEATTTREGSHRAGLNRALVVIGDLIQIELDEREKQARAFGE